VQVKLENLAGDNAAYLFSSPKKNQPLSVQVCHNDAKLGLKSDVGCELEDAASTTQIPCD
jgi:hypothetical protein